MRHRARERKLEIERLQEGRSKRRSGSGGTAASTVHAKLKPVRGRRENRRSSNMFQSSVHRKRELEERATEEHSTYGQRCKREVEPDMSILLQGWQAYASLLREQVKDLGGEPLSWEGYVSTSGGADV